MQWDILREGISEEVKEEKPPEARKKFVVPEDYLQNEKESINKLESKLRNAEMDQNELDEIYGEVVALLKRRFTTWSK